LQVALNAENKQKRFKAFSFENTRKDCNDFYWRAFNEEYNYFYEGIGDGSDELLKELKNSLEKVVNAKAGKQFIVRVGRWSQVDFVTFPEGFRKPETRKNKFGKPLGYGNTRTLFDCGDGRYLPMGWCVLSEKG